MLLSEEEYRQLPAELVLWLDAGVVIPGGGGLREIRWSLGASGKRGGSRVIYYWVVADDQLLMLFIYPKNVQDDLSPAQLKMLRQIVEDEYHGR
jgi:hypothetical protein